MIVDQSTKRLNDLRIQYQIAYSSLPKYRASQCGYLFYQAQEALDEALSAIVSDDFFKCAQCDVHLNSRLDLIDNLLQKSRQRTKSKKMKKP